AGRPLRLSSLPGEDPDEQSRSKSSPSGKYLDRWEQDVYGTEGMPRRPVNLRASSVTSATWRAGTRVSRSGMPNCWDESSYTATRGHSSCSSAVTDRCAKTRNELLTQDTGVTYTPGNPVASGLIRPGVPHDDRDCLGRRSCGTAFPRSPSAFPH